MSRIGLLLGLLLALVLIPRSAAQTVVGYIPGPAGAQALGPILPGANSVGAIASSVALGPSIASGLGGIAASSAVTALGLLAAYEQKMNTLKALTADILDAQTRIKSAVKADVTNTALNLVFTPMKVVEQKTIAMQGILAAGMARAGTALAGVVKLATDPVIGIPALLKTAAGVASALKNAPATVAKSVVAAGSRAVGSMKLLTGLVTPLLIGNKPLQLALARFNRKLTGMKMFFDGITALLSGWTGVNAVLTNSVTSVAKALGGVAGASAQALLKAPTGAWSSLGLFSNLIKGSG